MASETRIGKVIDQAIEEVNAEIMNRALAGLPRSASIGEIIEGFEAADFKPELEEMSLREFLAAVGSQPAKRGPGRPKGSGAEPKTAAKNSKSRVRNTRTAAGREELVRDSFAALSKLGGQANAETIRGEVGGEAAQVRRAMQTLVDQKMVKRQGKARATEYIVA